MSGADTQNFLTMAKSVSFGEAIKVCFNKYATFSGRASRSEYWYFALFSFILGLIPVVNWIAALALLIPGLAVAVRRLHDTGRSGWWYLICLVPIVGQIMLLVFFCTAGQPHANEYGE